MIQETSRISYQEEKKTGLSERHKEILDALSQGGPMTDREIQEFLFKQDANEVRPRRFELFQAAKIESTEKRKCRVTGKKALVWRIKLGAIFQLDLPLAS